MKLESIKIYFDATRDIGYLDYYFQNTDIYSFAFSIKSADAFCVFTSVGYCNDAVKL